MHLCFYKIITWEFWGSASGAPRATAQRIGRRNTKIMVGEDQEPESLRIKLLPTSLVRKTLADRAGS